MPLHLPFPLLLSSLGPLCSQDANCIDCSSDVATCNSCNSTYGAVGGKCEVRSAEAAASRAAKFQGQASRRQRVEGRRRWGCMVHWGRSRASLAPRLPLTRPLTSTNRLCSRQACGVTNCASCDEDTTTCTSCLDGFGLVNGTCQVRRGSTGSSGGGMQLRAGGRAAAGET